jgi:hypothetical protein
VPGCSSQRPLQVCVVLTRPLLRGPLGSAGVTNTRGVLRSAAATQLLSLSHAPSLSPLAGALQQVAADPNASINARLAALAAGGDASQSAVGGPSWSGWGVNGAAAPKGPWDGAAAAAAQQMEDRMNTMRNQRMEQSNWKVRSLRVPHRISTE